MASETDTKPINVAVVGGGMGGLCVAIGLLKHKHIRVQVYEGAHKSSEIGAGIACGPNAQRALALIGPDTEQAYLRQVTHNTSPKHSNAWFEYRYAMGPHEGEFIAAPKNGTGQATVHRAKFFDGFVALVPKEISHFAKRLVRIEEFGEAGVKLYLKDGTTETADCLIGADGVHSVTRKHLLGEGHPALNPMFTSSVAYRGLVPTKDAVEAIGEEYAGNSYIWCGKGGCIMTYPINFGETMNVVTINSSLDDWQGPWVVPATYDKISAEFKKWGTTAQKIIKLLDNADTQAWSMWDDPAAPTYCRGKVAMLGDAAHASTPFQGQGAGQALEDAYVLESLFAEVKDPANIAAAFQAYDRIRRPRTQKVTTTSREMGELVALRLPPLSDTTESMKAEIEWRMDWMWHRDIALESKQAIGIYQKLLRGEDLD